MRETLTVLVVSFEQFLGTGDLEREMGILGTRLRANQWQQINGRFSAAKHDATREKAWVAMQGEGRR